MAISSVLKDNFKFYFAFKTTSVFSYFKTWTTNLERPIYYIVYWK